MNEWTKRKKILKNLWWSEKNIRVTILNVYNWYFYNGDGTRDARNAARGELWIGTWERCHWRADGVEGVSGRLEWINLHWSMTLSTDFAAHKLLHMYSTTSSRCDYCTLMLQQYTMNLNITGLYATSLIHSSSTVRHYTAVQNRRSLNCFVIHGETLLLPCERKTQKTMTCVIVIVGPIQLSFVYIYKYYINIYRTTSHKIKL